MLRRRFFLALVAVATCVSCAAVWNPTLIGVELPHGVDLDLQRPPTYLPENPAGPQQAPVIEPSQNDGGAQPWPRDFHKDEWVV